jgi:bifunctional non-homologous end joining protein LigD
MGFQMLKEYKKKRDFTRTKEPAPKAHPGEGPLGFVVQKHSARALHYDFRLELDGVLKSWAVPTGPSLDPKEKRLAVMVEDHPLDYASFEGSIPQGEYGAGEVIVWDKGVYSPDEEGSLFEDRRKAEQIMRQNLEQGRVKIFLRGERLKGSWALVKMANRPKQWLLIKHSDQFASSSDVLKEGASVSSGLSLEEIKKGAKPPAKKSALLESDKIKQPAEKLASPELKDIKGARKAAFPGVFSPMLATLGKKPFSDPDWLFEPKLDGYRTGHQKGSEAIPQRYRCQRPIPWNHGT